MALTVQPDYTHLAVALQDARSVLPAMIIGAFLFGIYTLLLVLSIYIMKRKGLRYRSYAIMLAHIVLMYALAATSWAILVSSLLRVIESPQEYALVDARSLGMKDKTVQWCLGLNIFMSDIILTWRTLSLWSDARYTRTGRWVTWTACLLLLSTAVSGSVDEMLFSLQTTIPMQQYTGTLGYDNEPSEIYVNFGGKLSVILSAVLNVVCVLLTIVKTRQLEKLQKPIGRRLSENRVGLILLLLVSCGLAYCVFWVYWVTVGLWNVEPDLHLTLLICNNTVAVQIIGIYPSLVIVCVSVQQINGVDPAVTAPSFAQRQAASPFTFATSLIQPPANVLTTSSEYCPRVTSPGDSSVEENP
ncbi:unnamed protein product [Peniophora sp. CBMAI 1063]|nr:unnamed protein product [Peniophora sp. CBMAI 1063]